MKSFSEMRRKSQPLDDPSAGSIFKNPQEGPAGRWIEEAGLKGFRIGQAMVSDRHANFIVNLGKATARRGDRLNRVGGEEGLRRERHLPREGGEGGRRSRVKFPIRDCGIWRGANEGSNF